MRRAALSVCVAVIGALWVAAWLDWLAALGLLPPPSYAALAAFAATAALLGWVLAELRVPTGLGQLLNVGLALGLGLALLLLLLQPRGAALGLGAVSALGNDLLSGQSSVWLLLLAVAWLWWTGLRAGAARQTHASVWRRVRLALVALAVLAVVTRLSQLSQPPDLGLPLALGTLLVLAALALAQMADVAEDLYTLSSGVGGQGLTLALLAMALAGGLGLALSGLVSVDQGRALLQPLAPAGRLLRAVLIWVLSVAAGAGYAIGDFVRRLLLWLQSLFGGPQEVPPIVPPAAQPQIEDLLQSSDGPWFPWLMGGVLLVVLLLLIGWLARAYRRYNDRQLGPGGVERSSALGVGRVWQDALGLAQALWTSLSGVAGRLGTRPSGVRALYRELLVAGAERGHPRAAPVTPFEYEPEVEAALPGAAAEVVAITDAYVAARYGDRPPSPEYLAQLREQWRQAQGAGEGGRAG